MVNIKRLKIVVYLEVMVLLALMGTIIISANSKNGHNGYDTIRVQPISDDSELYRVKGNQFLVEGFNTSGIYKYYIYDTAGIIVEEGQVERVAPEITYISENVIKICFHGGTYADLCKYYDIKRNIFSQLFWNPFVEHNGLIVYFNEKLIVQDIFEKSKFYQEFLRDMSLVAPPYSIEFIDNDRKLHIAYETRTNEVISEVIDLD